MTANAGYHAYATGDVLTAAQVQYNLQNQTVMYFATTTARDAALTGAILVEGMVSYTPATGLMYYNGSAWASVSGSANVPTLSNPVLNSAFQVWQRGTSVAIAASSTAAYAADRWSINTNANQAFTFSRQTTSDTTNLPFIQYCGRIQRNSGQTGTSTMAVAQSFETINSIPFVGKTVTMSFYARAGANYSATSNALAVYLQTGTGTDQNVLSGFTGQAQAISQTATLTTTWQRFSYSATLATSVTQLAPTFGFTPTGTAGANDYFEITGVQLEIGSNATPFDTYATTIQGELAACQRYYYRSASDGAYKTLGNGYAATTGALGISVPFPVTLRITPSSVDTSAMATFYWESSTSGNTPTSVFLGNTNTTIGVVTVSKATAFTAGLAYTLLSNNTAAYIGFSAEL